MMNIGSGETDCVCISTVLRKPEALLSLIS